MTDRVTPSSRDSVGPPDLEVLVAQHYERLLRVAVLICRNHADAEDAVQVALERAWRHGDSLQDAERLSAWLRRIVVHEAIRIDRRRQSLLARWFAGPREIELEPEAPPARDLALRDALERLSPEQRAAIALHYLEGYSVAETAVLMSVPLETARSRLRSARERLRTVLKGRE